MAARKQLFHPDEVRRKIQTSQLINRLQSFALGNEDPQTKKAVEMTSDQVRAALGLIKKTVPDLSQQTLEGSSEQPIEVIHRVIVGSGNRDA